MKTLKDLTKEELRELYKNNKQFNSVVYELAYDDAMYWQGEEFKLMGAVVFDYNDHYSSFYLSTPRVYGSKTPEKVAGELDADYMTPENSELYKKLCDKIDEWENMTTDEQEEEKGERVYDDACELCDKLADGLTEQFRAYENITEEQCEQVLDAILDGNYSMSEWETDGKKVFEHITKVYE